jgi:hypothetical protein
MQIHKRYVTLSVSDTCAALCAAQCMLESPPQAAGFSPALDLLGKSRGASVTPFGRSE